MSEQFLHQNGPVSISDTDYQDYREHWPQQAPTFDELFYAWICQRPQFYSNGFRRLCLRDLLRQPYFMNAQTTAVTHYHTKNPPLRLFFIGSEHNYDPAALSSIPNKSARKPTRVLYWTLYNSPTLQHELLQEFLWLVENDCYGPIYNPFRTQLVELLLTLPADPYDETCNYSSSRIFSCFPYGPHDHLDSPSSRDYGLDETYTHTWLREYLHLLQNPQLPAFIHTYIYNAIDTLIQQNCTALQSHDQKYHPFDCTKNAQVTPGFYHISRWIKDHLNNPSPETINIFNHLITELELALPNFDPAVPPRSVTPYRPIIPIYLSLTDVVKLTPYLPVSMSTFNFLRRHLLATVTSDTFEYRYQQVAASISINHLRWLLGYCAQNFPDSTNLHYTIIKTITCRRPDSSPN